MRPAALPARLLISDANTDSRALLLSARILRNTKDLVHANKARNLAIQSLKKLPPYVAEKLRASFIDVIGKKVTGELAKETKVSEAQSGRMPANNTE